MSKDNSPNTQRRHQERALLAYLVASAKLGDRKAVSQLYEFAAPRLVAHASRLLGEAEQARDAAQEAWVEILRGLGRLRDGAAFMPWALRITSRRVARLIKRRQKDRKLAQGWAEEAETSTPSEGGLANDAAAVRAAIDRLSPDHRATVALFYLEELSVAEVAMALDVPIGTIKTRLMHARSKLRAQLEGEKDE